MFTDYNNNNNNNNNPFSAIPVHFKFDLKAKSEDDFKKLYEMLSEREGTSPLFTIRNKDENGKEHYYTNMLLKKINISCSVCDFKYHISPLTILKRFSKKKKLKLDQAKEHTITTGHALRVSQTFIKNITPSRTH